MELCSFNIKKYTNIKKLIFSQKKGFHIFQETELFYFLGETSIDPKAKTFCISPKKLMNTFF